MENKSYSSDDARRFIPVTSGRRRIFVVPLKESRPPLCESSAVSLKIAIDDGKNECVKSSKMSEHRRSGKKDNFCRLVISVNP